MTASEVDEPGPVANSTAARPMLAGVAHGALRALARPALQGLLALMAYLAVYIILWTTSLLRDPSLPQVSQATMDPNWYIWSLRWWPYALSHGLNPLYSHQIGAPAGFDLSWTTTTPPLDLIMAPVTAVFGPVAALNLSVLLLAPVSAWVAFLAVRRLTGRFWAALAGGAVYGFSPYELGHNGAGQTNLAFIMLLPLLVYLVLLWRDGKLGNLLFTGLMALTMAAEFYVFDEAFAEMTVLGAVALLIGYLVARPGQRREVARLAGLAAVSWVVAIVLAAPYLEYALRSYKDHAGFVKALPAYSLPLNTWLHPVSGILLLLAALALAVLTWSSRLTRLLVIVLALIVLLAIGPRPVAGTTQLGALPWARLWSLPLARSAEPTRLMLFGYLVLAITLALWLAAPGRNRLLLAGRWIVGLATVAAILTYLPSPFNGNFTTANAPSAALRPTNSPPAFISDGRYRDYLRPGEIVVVVSDRGNAGLLFQAYTNFYFRIGGGFINAAITPSDLPPPVAALIQPTPAAEQQFRVYVRQAGIGAILVERAWSEPWMQVFSKMGLHGTLVGGVIVYPTG